MMAIPWYFVDVVARPSIFIYFYLIITFLTLFWVCIMVLLLIGILEKKFLSIPI